MNPVERQMFTVEAYYKMGEAGVFEPSDRVELIRGEIFKMSPISSRHAGVVNYLARTFFTELGSQVSIAIQNPIRIRNHSEPEPDIVVAHYRADDYRNQHPTPSEIYLIIEVAESSLEYDKTTKLALYAEAGIPEYWVVNLEENSVEVFTNPVGSHYNQQRAYPSGTVLNLQQFSANIEVKKLLGE